MSDHADREHAVLGASSCHRWWNCPGSVRLSEGLPNRSSAHAEAGTRAHEMAERCLKDGIDAPDEHVQVYLDDCRATGEAEGVADLQVLIEVRFTLETLRPPAPMFGTADFVAYSPSLRKLWVKDYKNGYMHVHETSPQLRYYAIGAALFLGPDRPVHEVEVTVVQPNGSADPVRRAGYAVPELAAWAKELLAHAKATQAPDAPLVPGEWCKFCPARGVCKARMDMALQAAGVEFGPLVSGEATPPETRLLSPDDLAALLHKLGALEDFIAAVRAAAHGELASGRPVGDWKLVAKRPVRSFANEETAAAELRDHLGIDPYERKLISPAKAEAALADRMPGKTKKDRAAAAKGALAPLVQSISSGATLAPGADPRPALLIGDAGAEFGALPDDTNL